MPAGARSLLCAAVTLALGCNINNPGDEPPRGLLYFPNALVLSKHAEGEAPRYLFIANSDFDLRYSAGSVQAFSLERLEPKVRACASKPTCEIEPSQVFEDEVLIGAFSTALALSRDGRHLFASTRTENALDYVRVDASKDGDGVLSCGGTDRHCGLHSAAPDLDATKDNGERMKWPADPQAILTGPLADWAAQDASVTGDYVLVSHFGGQISLFVFEPGKVPELRLTSVLTGRPAPLTQLAYDEATRLVHVGSAAPVGSLLDRVGIGIPRDDAGNLRPQAATVYEAGVLLLTGGQQSSSTFDVAFLPVIADAGVALAQNRALVVSQSPSALLVVDVDGTRNGPNLGRVERAAVVGGGASRMAIGLFPEHPLAVVGSFNARELTFIDLATMQNRALIPNLSGPYAMAIDEARKLLYVADFRSSVLRVVDLSPLLEPIVDPELRVIATIGRPHVLQELR